METGVNVFCFAASYSVAMLLEISGVWARWRGRRVAVLIAASAGLVAHTWYLGRRVAETSAAPLASHHDWYLLAAWASAVVYLAVKFYYPRSSIGLFLMPAVLALVGASQLAEKTPLATFQAPREWGRIHGILLLLGTVAVLLGFIAGVMYLVQSYRLKHKMPAGERLRLPSLEWLERANGRALGAATLFVGGGFVTGVLSRMTHEGGQNFLPWTDPVVLSLAAMTIWLVVAEIFRLVYPAARHGQKVAYLTIAAFVFLLLVLGTMTVQDSLHQTLSSETLLPKTLHPVTDQGGSP